MNDIPQKYRSEVYRLLEFVSDLGILDICYNTEQRQYILRMGNNDELIRISKDFVDEYLRLRNY